MRPFQSIRHVAVRFQKQVGATPTALGRKRAVVEPKAIAKAKERTVFVVNVNHLQRFLHYFKLEYRELINIMKGTGEGPTS